MVSLFAFLKLIARVLERLWLIELLLPTDLMKE